MGYTQYRLLKELETNLLEPSKFENGSDPGLVLLKKENIQSLNSNKPCSVKSSKTSVMCCFD